MSRLMFVIACGVGGLICGWGGYELGGAGEPVVVAPGAEGAGPMDTSGASEMRVRVDAKQRRRDLAGAARRVHSDRSDAAYAALHGLLDEITVEELPGVVVSVEGMNEGQERDYLLRILISRLAAADPLTTYRYCTESGLEEYMVSVFAELAKRDGTGGWERLEAFLEDFPIELAKRGKYVAAVFEAWSQQDLEGAFGKALEIDERLTVHAAPAFWKAVQDQGAREWLYERILAVPEVSETSHRESFVHFAALEIASRDRVAALEWLYGAGIDGRWITDVELQMVGSWADDPRAAAEWLYATIRDDGSNDRFEKIDHIATAWGGRDREACVAWLEERGEGAAAREIGE